MNLVRLTERATVEAFYRRDPARHLYELGDLDDFYWPHTIWYAAEQDGEVRQVVLLYTPRETPILLATGEAEEWGDLRWLLNEILPLLPSPVYAHVNRETLPILTRRYSANSYGLHYRMYLRETGRLDSVDSSGVVPLTPADREEAESLYRHYPDSWFDARMLETGRYCGIREPGAGLTSIAGVHAYSPAYRVAALGNIMTHPDWRGKGLATKVTAAVCRALSGIVDHIGLNVHTENQAAIACYQKLGFEIITTYEEVMLQ